MLVFIIISSSRSAITYIKIQTFPMFFYLLKSELNVYVICKKDFNCVLDKTFIYFEIMQPKRYKCSLQQINSYFKKLFISSITLIHLFGTLAFKIGGLGFVGVNFLTNTTSLVFISFSQINLMQLSLDRCLTDTSIFWLISMFICGRCSLL